MSNSIQISLNGYPLAPPPPQPLHENQKIKATCGATESQVAWLPFWLRSPCAPTSKRGRNAVATRVELQSADSDGSGTLDRDEFVEICRSVREVGGPNGVFDSFRYPHRLKKSYIFWGVTPQIPFMVSFYVLPFFLCGKTRKNGLGDPLPLSARR